MLKSYNNYRKLQLLSSCKAAALAALTFTTCTFQARAAEQGTKSDMLLPEQVPLEVPNSSPTNQNGAYFGANIAFGQGYSTDGGSPGTTALLRFEPGYQIGTSSWHRVELSGELLTGSTSFRHNAGGTFDGKYTLDVNYGFLAKIGYGYSLGTKMFGIAKLGAGALVGTLKAKANGESVKSDTTTGTAIFLGWSMIVPVGGSVDLTGGISTTHAQFDVDSLKAGSASYRYGRNVVVNIPTIDLGLRVRI